jgi:hypothetical protein
MKPANDHEKAIAWRVDRKCVEDPDCPYHLIVRDIAMALDFIMSPADTQFLVRYIQWRHARPQSADLQSALAKSPIQ